jgi:hypothetical protein
MEQKLKYVNVGVYSSIIIFPEVIEHKQFKHLNPISAGFISIDHENKRARCYGDSFTLGIDSRGSADSYFAIQQLFGIEEAELYRTELLSKEA